MKSSVRSLRLVIAWACLFGCSGSPLLQIDVDSGINQPVNPFNQVQQLFDADQLAGIYFVFDPLNCPMSDINEVSGGASVSYPNLSLGDPGSDLRTEYEIPTESLSPTTFYRVTMAAIPTSGGTPPYQGVGDCPLKLNLESANLIKICFGVNPSSPAMICPGATPLSQCPGNPMTTCQ